MLKNKIKRKKRAVAASSALQSSKIKKILSNSASSLVSFFRKIRDYFGFKYKIFCILFKALGANPKKISLKEEGGETLLLVSRKKSKQSYWKKFIKKFSKVLRYPERKIIKGTAIVSTIALFLQFSISLMPFTKANDLCPADADAILVMDISNTMAGGGSQSMCRWCEKKWNDEGTTKTWFLNTKYNVDSDWCSATRDQFDESYELGYYISPTYTPSKNSKIEDAKTATNSFLDNLKTTDQSALVSFGSNAVLVGSLSNDHLALKTSINSLTTEGTNATNIGDAIAQASGELSSARANLNANKVMIILTDGKANKPNGYGYGEYADDVAYAQSKAQEAAGLGQKIFTIGLGSASDINEAMLQNIASSTGGQYYYASEGNQLAGIYSQIYSQISVKTCEYASISGCKYLDADQDGNIEDATTTLSGWAIVLSGDATSTKITDENGCYSFTGLSNGNYTVSEGENNDKKPYLQTYPASKVYNLTLILGQKSENIDFGNADSSLCNATETSRQCIADGQEEITYVSDFAYCGENNKERQENATCTCAYSEWQDGVCVADGQRRQTRTQTSQFDYCTVLTQNREDSSCSGLIGPICGNSLLEQDEVCDSGNQGCTVSGYTGVRSCNQTCDGWNACNTNESCGDGIKNGPEQCDDSNTQSGDGCSSACQTEQTQQQGTGSGAGSISSGSGGGSIVTSHLQFTSNSFKNAGVATDSIIITWLTNILSTSRVIYDTAAHSTLGAAPNYGYAFSTIEDLNKVTSHSVEISGLTPDTTYFWRVISSASPEIVSEELSFSTIKKFTIEEIEKQLKEIGDKIAIITKDLNPSSPEVSEALAIEEPALEQEAGENVELANEEIVQVSPSETAEQEQPAPEEKAEDLGNKGLLATIGVMPFNLGIILIIAGIIMLGLFGLLFIKNRKPKI